MSFIRELLTTGLLQLCLALAIALALLTTPLASDPQVRLAQGTVRGFAEGPLEYFRGIRYALTTEGSGRYRRPRPIWEHLDHVFEKESIQVNRTGADGVFDASFYSPSCPQFVPPAFMGGYTPPLPEGRVQEVVSEDCLSVSVTRPKVMHEPLPVLVYIYGGAWLMGADFPHDPKHLVTRSIVRDEPMILVQLNYRVASFGFMSGPALEEEARNGNADLNVGLHDQRTALRWVQRNIARFGGDPNRVTISGESAGGMSTMYQMFASDRAGEKLFSGAIIQSGGGSVGTVLPSNFRHRDRYAAFLGSTPCAHKATARDQLDCLRGLPTQAVQAANTRSIMYLLGLKQEKSWQSPFFFPWTPVIDGDFISGSPYELVKEGKYADVPLLVGNTLDEGTLFTPTDLHNETVLLPWMHRSVLAAEGVPLGEKDHVMHKVLAAYPDDPRVGSPYGRDSDERLFGEKNQYERAASILGDMIFVAPTRHLLNSHAGHHRKTKTHPVWSWILDEAGPGDDPAVGVPHSADLDYLFIPRASYLFFKPPAEYRLPGTRWAAVADQMADAWVHFVSRGNPNGAGVPKWPFYAPADSIGRMPAATLTFKHMNPHPPVRPLTARAANISMLLDDAEVREVLAF